MKMDDKPTALGYNSLKNDPVALLELINKFVEIYVNKGCKFIGFVHSVDPVSYSIILYIPHEESYRPTLIPGHAIMDVKELSPPPNVTKPIRKTVELETEEIVAERKNKLVAWLKFNFLPVLESSASEITVGNVSILPPYTVADICTDNPIVALQIKKFLENMPSNFEISCESK